ncbi:hypothetical protein B0H14DRAFT_3777586 [Mycena olivaceomarginata]|nr:hypothetical protein B0H14DRAFT_3777586 [Mycena olivaceomarginata]
MLLAKIPADFLLSYGISVPPPAARTQDVACQVTAARERRSHMPAQDSRLVEARGLARPAPALVRSAGTVKPVSPARADAVTMDAPCVPVVAAPGVSPSSERLRTSVKPHWGQDRARSPPRGESTPSSNVSIADLALEYVAGHNSLSQRAAAIIHQKTLEIKDFVDRGDDCGPLYIGQFSLEHDLFISVDKTVAEMQLLLTRTSSLAGRSSPFIIDPHRDVIHTLRGTANLPLLQVVWDELVHRMCIARDAFELYCLGQNMSDPVRQACDAASLRQMQAFEKECVHKAAEARRRRECPEVAQAAVIAISPPERSSLLPAARAPVVFELPPAPSHPSITQAISTEDSQASERAPAPAAGAAVKDPPSVHTLIAAKPTQAPSRRIAQEIRIEDFQALGRAPASAVITVVKDPPRTTSSGASLLPAATPSAMEASSKVEAIASVRVRKAMTEEQAPLVLHHAQVQPKVAVDNLVEPLHRLMLADSGSAAFPACSSSIALSASPTFPISSLSPSEAARIPSAPPAELVLVPEDVVGECIEIGGPSKATFAMTQSRVASKDAPPILHSIVIADGGVTEINSPCVPSLVTSSSPVVAPAAAVEQSSSAHTFVSALPAHPIEDLVSLALAEATENIGNVHGSAVLAAAKDPLCRTPGVSLLPTNEPIEFMGIITMDTPQSGAVYASPEPSTARAPMREHAAERDVEPGGQQNIAFATNPVRVASEEEPRTWNPVEFGGSFLEHCALRVPFPLTSSPFDSSPSASVIAYLDFALVSAILRTFWTTYLVWIKCEDAAPCLAWEREGIGTGPWN